MKFCHVLFYPHNIQHSRLLIIQKKKCVYPARLPQQLHKQHSPAPVMRFGLPTSPKPDMRNDDIKERWKFFNVTIKTQWLGRCAKAAIQSQLNCVFFILRSNLALHLVYVVSVVFSCDIIPPHHKIYVIISRFIHCGLKISPLCFTWKGLRFFEDACTP